MKKLPLLIAAGVGYVLGTKAGRERYEQIRGAARRIGNDPRVQEKAQQATDLARQQAPVVKDKLTDAASAAASKVRHDDSGSGSGSASGSASSGAATTSATSPSSPATHSTATPAGDTHFMSPD